jgi:hypothetical protein
MSRRPAALAQLNAPRHAETAGELQFLITQGSDLSAGFSAGTSTDILLCQQPL